VGHQRLRVLPLVIVGGRRQLNQDRRARIAAAARALARPDAAKVIVDRALELVKGSRFAGPG